MDQLSKYPWVKQATNEQLTRWSEENRIEIESAEQEIERLQERIKAFQDEIERRVNLPITKEPTT